MKRLIKQVFGSTSPGDIFFDLITFDRLITRPVIHLIYWAGLSLLLLSAFGVLGATVGIAMREEAPWGWFLAVPFLIGGLLFVFAGILLWRSFCEFYVAIFRIADDLRFLRKEAETASRQAPVAPAPEPRPTLDPQAPIDMGDPKDVMDSPFTNVRPAKEN
ncbi:DUF4282 domain-containing protein [Asticcacaulis sp. ZE23SCel15]|jgi:hypothetical protein|uniref:DUF4282 domain-containing protein n=1 Tax=Asticcacaulis sp. ZE23SCel15 TaxID=3059027 RepID=UPI00265D6335|nr:DUF4282 domain-containing protein [Asticcacaulis sp. ZE23SCel15]WKL57781.1 DUF4282 domain-containing protein [Asticcacaulis sp. ZE23SCel15]